MNNIFLNGSKWLRFDCHLHTKADREFKYLSEENNFVGDYVQKLKAKQIDIGVITNHNKFDLDEYKALRAKAKKENIYLLPGVELSVNDGSNGIHTLVVFNPDEWIENGNNYIDQFINESFAGQHNYQNENSRSNDNFVNTIKKLNHYNRSYFIILAHVEQKSGFFSELDGGRIIEFGKNPLFREKVVAFQKVTKYDLSTWNSWLDNNLPPFVEGSDPKNIEDIGKGAKSYIKLGDFNFEAVLFALKDKQHRVSKEYKEATNAFVESMSFDGGKLHGKTIQFSSSMNNFVGIRGSGKSSIIEALRYGLDLSHGGESSDVGYKNNLIKELLGSAGKIIIIAYDKNKNRYEISRVYGHAVEIKKDDQIVDLNIYSILNKPLYFGQKDLSNYKDDFESDLISKLIGDKTKSIKEQIETKKQEIKIQLENIKKYKNLDEKELEIKQKIEELKIRIDEFKKHKIEEKLKKQIEFNKDKTNIESIKKRLKEFANDLSEFLGRYESNDFFDTLKTYRSKENQDIFDTLYLQIDETKSSFLEITTRLHKLLNDFKKIDDVQSVFDERFKNLHEDFLKIQRDIDIPNLRADDFISYTKNLQTQELMQIEIEKSKKIKKDLHVKLIRLLSELSKLYKTDYNIVEKEIEKINAKQSFVQLQAEFKGNRKVFEEFLRSVFSGSGLGGGDYQKLLEYQDGIEMFKDFESIVFGGNKLLAFREKFNSSLSAILTYQVANKIEIFYRGKELRLHSLGQRASALIIFVLTQRDNDIVIIDQPEDDLDNQTIYKEVIKELLKLKEKTQFIFATHNANIPVLGDCEQVLVCQYKESSIELESGSIDSHNIQNKIIDIMEGGDDAFTKRKEIYSIWKH